VRGCRILLIVIHRQLLLGKSKTAAEIDDVIALGHVMLALATRALSDGSCTPQNELAATTRLRYVLARNICVDFRTTNETTNCVRTL